MKARSMISGMLIGFGCAMTFLGFLAVIAPGINNEQLNLVLNSFNVSAKNAAIYAFNSFARFLLENSWQTAAVGGLALGIGLWLFGFAEKEQDEEETAPYRPVRESKAFSYVRSLPESSPIHTPVPVRKEPEPPVQTVSCEEFPSSNPFARPYAPFVPSKAEPVGQKNVPFSNTPTHMAFPSYSVDAQQSVNEKESAFCATPSVFEMTQEISSQPVTVTNDFLPSDAPAASFESNDPDPTPPVRIKSTIGMHRKW